MTIEINTAYFQNWIHNCFSFYILLYFMRAEAVFFITTSYSYGPEA